ncbi:MAG: glycosyltransferase family 2 protein [Acidobacteria bacterium]|nr:MAG: glycosyltransferase family 2 protein [Acidobacteriota bacterium]
MGQSRKLFSVCIPAYNRAHHLPALLDSILAQGLHDYEIVICEDMSRERQQIERLVRDYQSRYPDVLRYFENEANLGYDGNIRNLVEKASGEFCFFMGNDDIMCEGALENAAGVIGRHPNVGLVLKSYAWFDEVPEKINQEIRWFKEEKEFAAGIPAIRFAFRRSGVISGYIVRRDSANDIATAKFDGTLYYQMYLTANVLLSKTAVCTPKVLVLCRSNEPHDFGNSEREKGKYVPGTITSQSRLNMVGGAISIIRDLKETREIDVVEDVIRDYANYFYPYIKDQFTLPLGEYFRLYREFGKMGFARYPLFHVYFLLGFILGEKKFDAMTAVIRNYLGRSPQF